MKIDFENGVVKTVVYAMYYTLDDVYNEMINVASNFKCEQDFTPLIVKNVGKIVGNELNGLENCPDWDDFSSAVKDAMMQMKLIED